MSDNLELILKEAVKKIIAEAVAEAAGQQAVQMVRATAMPAPSLMRCAKPTQAFSIWREKFMLASKSVACLAAAGLVCGVVGITLFAPELAQAAMGGDMYGHSYYALPAPAIDGSPSSPADAQGWQGWHGRRVAEVSWKDLASMDKVEEMLKEGAILHAAPEDLSAIVIFFMLRKLAKGEPIHINNLQSDFRDSLPEYWLPAYDAIIDEYPEHQLDPLPHWFAAPKRQ